MYVKNVSGSSRFAKPRGYNSWLDYWKAQTGKILTIAQLTIVGVQTWLVLMFKRLIAMTNVGI